MNVPMNDNNSFQYNNVSQSKEFNQNQPALLPNPPGMPNIPQQGFNQPQGNFPPNQNQMPNIPRSTGPSQGNSNATLVLRKVPNELNHPDIIRQHFLKFGQILDVQSNYDNLNDAALIKFSNNQSAFAAFKSPESILNNRFIRIHWLNHYQKHQQQQNPNLNQQNFQQQRHPQHIQHQPPEDEPTMKRHVKDRLAFDTQADSFNQQELIKNKENKHLDKLSTDASSSTAAAGSSMMKTGTGSDVDQNTNLPRDESTKQDGTGQVLSSNFNSMTIKQAEKNKYQENLAAKAISDENQKVRLQHIISEKLFFEN